MRTTQRYVADADPQNILEPPTAGGFFARILFLLVIFSVLITASACGINFDDTKAAG